MKVSLCSFVFAKRPERPCNSLELLYEGVLDAARTARVSLVLRTCSGLKPFVRVFT